MTRVTSALEINKFIAGLVTDANPLTFPPNASVEEENFVLNIDGSRRRRLGLDFEDGYVEITTTIADAALNEPAFSSYKWSNAGGDPEKNILVIQIGNEVKFFDLATTPISNNLMYTYVFSGASSQQNFAYAVVDGLLVVTSGQKQPVSFQYTSPSTITATARTLKIRDLFGVADTISSTDLWDSITKRPTSITDAHTYNLRNMTYAHPRPQGNTEAVDDPITYFKSLSTTTYPSLSDNLLTALYADPADAGGPTLKRFFAQDIISNPPGTVRSPMGYFIIDALARGTDRLSKVNALNSQYSTLDFPVSTLPTDTTPGGPTCVSEFAGRAFFAGFSGDVTGGDANSPHMSSYVLFSQLVKKVVDVYQCYQDGDPTNFTSPDLVATDGGFIRVNEAYGILALKNVGESLLVCAKNGVWRIYGGGQFGFDATNYLVERITDHGIISLDSLVLVDNTVMFWGQDGLYHVHTTDQGGWVCENISYGNIQRLYEAIPLEDKKRAKGAYDAFERKVRWIYHNRLSDTAEVNELILDINLKAYYINAIKQFEGTVLPRTLAPFIVNPYQVIIDTQGVTVQTDPVIAAGVPVVVPLENVFGSSIKEINYLTVTQLSPVVKYTFALYRDPTWHDWKSVDDVGVDAAAFITTGYFANSNAGSNDFMRLKSVPYLFVHCIRTENGFTEDINGDLYPNNPSSCLIQTRWEWSDSANSKRWSPERQAYRYKRLYIPDGPTDSFDTGFATVVTKNKVRGQGKVLSIRFATEENNDLYLLGWSMIMAVNNNV